MALLALINNYLERPQQVIELIHRTMDLDPGYTWDYPFNLGFAYYQLQDYEKAIENISLVLDRNQNARLPRLILVACYMAMGQAEDAEWEMEQLRLQAPDYSISFMLQEDPIRNTPTMNRYINQLRKSGLPE